MTIHSYFILHVAAKTERFFPRMAWASSQMIRQIWRLHAYAVSNRCRYRQVPASSLLLGEDWILGRTREYQVDTDTFRCVKHFSDTAFSCILYVLSALFITILPMFIVRKFLCHGFLLKCLGSSVNAYPHIISDRLGLSFKATQSAWHLKIRLTNTNSTFQCKAKKRKNIYRWMLIEWMLCRTTRLYPLANMMHMDHCTKVTSISGGHLSIWFEENCPQRRT